jgi:3-deoxy-D-manno-octulosonate 8-phosphate phosphatase KdsC-like HAD superfamily phosphatase
MKSIGLEAGETVMGNSVVVVAAAEITVDIEVEVASEVMIVGIGVVDVAVLEVVELLVPVGRTKHKLQEWAKMVASPASRSSFCEFLVALTLNYLIVCHL